MDALLYQKLLKDVKARKGSFVEGFKESWRDLALARANAGNPSLIQLRAGIVEELVKAAPLMINPGWSLAGEHLLAQHAWPSFVQFRIKEREELEREFASLGAASETDAALEAFRRYHSRCSATAPGESQASLQLGASGWGDKATTQVFMEIGWKENHSIRNYEKLLRIGFNGLKREIEGELSSHAIIEPDYPERENFLLAVLKICAAGAELGRRYAELAGSLAKQTPDAGERERLLAMAACCRRVPAEGATTFREAVQSLWFGHLVTCAEDGINANSLGRLDQLLNPYLLRDLERGVITRAEAVDLMAELAAKLYLDYDVQAITLGGVDASGKCAINEMSYIILEATALFGEVRDLSVRIDSKTPDKFLDACSKLVVRGGGIPFFFNDECFIPALAARGIKLEDARGYAPIGCVELTIPGKANPHAVSGWFNLLKCLELALNNGVDPLSGSQVGPATGAFSSFKTFQELFDACKKQVEFFATRMVYNCRRGELAQREFGPLPAWSLLTDDCVKAGRDITAKGALYNYHSICLMGVPDTADALAALKLCVYGDSPVSPETVLAALKSDFKGFENLRKQLLSLPKYGNGDDLPDTLASELSSFFIALMDKCSVPGNEFFVHLFTFKLNIDFGRKVGATPDGRLSGEPLAYSLSAHQGRDLNGVTALFHSLARQPHAKAAAGSAAIIDLHPSIVEGEKGVALLSTLMRTAVKMGIGQIQWNVVSAERLEKAKADPENFGNIAVRVAGYSQYFRLLDPALQDHIIARHKHGKL